MSVRKLRYDTGNSHDNCIYFLFVMKLIWNVDASYCHILELKNLIVIESKINVFNKNLSEIEFYEVLKSWYRYMK